MNRPAEQQLIGESQCFLEVLEHVSRVAQLNRPVLVIGERGTGKELIAARIHYLSPRWDRPFIKLNCAALTESLLETELFGHEAGSFTGATRRRLVRFELAHQGSLLLDELAKQLQIELPVAADARQPIRRVEAGNRRQAVRTVLRWTVVRPRAS